jgi:LemA protein
MGIAVILSLVAVAIVVVLAAMVAGIYNRLVRLRQRTLNSFSQIDVQLKRRHDLIPNLIEAVKGYMAHEQQTLTKIVEARSAVNAALQNAGPQSTAGMGSLIVAEQQLQGSLGQLMAMREAYPDLKADKNASQLMEQLSSTENRVGFARQAYNDSVMDYNTARQSFPDMFFAGMFGFAEAPLFQIENATEREVVAVSLGRDGR